MNGVHSRLILETYTEWYVKWYGHEFICPDKEKAEWLFLILSIHCC